MKFSVLLLLFLIAIIAIGAVGCIRQETTLPTEEQAQVRAYADPITDSLMRGFNEDNYSLYSRDFSSDMKSALDAATFEQNQALIKSKIGLYLSRVEAVVTRSGDYLAANYKADFEQEQGVDVRVVFKTDDASHQIYGLWFNSPKLRS
jgi:isocitrate dehydrogenase kinase/phosphatase